MRFDFFPVAFEIHFANTKANQRLKQNKKILGRHPHFSPDGATSPSSTFSRSVVVGQMKHPHYRMDVIESCGV